MIGAIAGDLIGSVYEHHPIKTTDFPLFQPRSRFTDDSEPPRLSRRLQHLRVWSHEDINKLFTGSQGASRSHGAGASRRA